MKKKFMIFLSLLIFFTITVTAQKPADFTGSLLWKVSGKDLTKPSYIFGTFHLMGSELTEHVPGLKEAMETTDRIVGELNSDDMAALQAGVMQAVMLSEEESYKNLLSEEEYSRLDEGLKKLLGAGLDHVGMYKPGFLSSQIAVIIYSQVNPTFNPTTFEAIDAYLQRVAGENNKSSIGLETVEDQINALFNSGTQLNQMRSLICTVENVGYQLHAMKTMIADYLSGNIYKMYADAYENEKDPCREFTLSLLDVLNKPRNDKWLKQLPAMMKEKPSLIAVGALHLAGEYGILYELSKMGYKVEAVR
jgi:uncharacterized protein YbaP (TraB family)